MSNKVLVTYASRGGSTAGIAEVIGKTLTKHGLDVDVQPMQDSHDLTPYKAVVAGSAIHKEKWLPEAMQFMNRYQHELAQKDFAAFMVCLALAVNNKQMRERATETTKTWLQPVRNLVMPISEGYFAGVLNLSKLPHFGYRVLAWLGILIGMFSEGDHRDWDAIQAWANDLAEELSK